MNNLYRELAPISAAAWASIEDEARRTFTLHLAGRRIAEVRSPDAGAASAVGTGHLSDVEPPAPGVLARTRTAQPVIELRVPFAVSRQAVDDVERGAKDPDWQPVKDAARTMAFAEDRAVFEGYPAAGITGIRATSSNPALAVPSDARQYPDVISQALSSLRLAGVGGPYALLLSADAYTAVSETSDHGYPVRDHLSRLIDGPIVWAPAIDGAIVLTTRGGDFEMVLAQDLSIGYTSHDADTVHLYFTQALTFLAHTAEAAVPLGVGRA
jgi:uncharacterized linocin/CFP29 family protein